MALLEAAARASPVLPASAPPSAKLEWIRTLITAISAGAAITSAVIASRAVRDQAAARKRERRANIYSKVVLDPGIALIAAFEIGGAEVIDSHASGIVAKCNAEGAQLADVEGLVREFSLAYKTLTDPLFNRLVTLANAWGRDDLRQSVIDAVSGVEDLSEEFSHLIADKNLQPRLAQGFRLAVARLLGVLATYDNFDN